MKKVFIDGSAGTTGLRIYERLSFREDITLLRLTEELRKDKNARKDIMNEADIVFLCLPDEAAMEAVTMVDNPDTVILDTSTAHRTAPGWAYGFPELSGEFEQKIIESKRIAVPGCHASGFIALVKPLIENGLLPSNASLCCHSLTGYSGGGKKMIGDYTDVNRSPLLDSPGMYALSGNHKHLKEMKAIARLEKEPVFCPIVSDFYSGMLVTVPLFAEQLAKGCTPGDIVNVYKKQYSTGIVSYKEKDDGNGFIYAGGLSGSDAMEISLFGNEERILLCARYDNLGKGASGAAIECMNIKLGVNKGLNLVI